MACIIGMMFFASCTQEQIEDFMAQKPEVEFVAEEGFISGNCGVYFGTELNFKVTVAPNGSSESELSSFDFSIVDQHGNVVFNQKPEFENPAGENTFTFKFTPEAASLYGVTATITDQAGKSNAAVLSIDYVIPVEPGVGVFEGTVNLTGHVTSNAVAGQTIDETKTFENLATTITLGELNEETNRLMATIEVDGTPVTLEATMIDNEINFDRCIYYRTMPVEIGGIPFASLVLDLAVDLTATIDNGVMTLGGTAVGSGKAYALITVLEANFDGTMDGVLNQVVE